MIDVVSGGEKGATDNCKEFLLDIWVCSDTIHIEIGNLE